MLQRLGTLVVITMSLTACGSFHLYDQKKETLAAETLKRYQDAKLLEALQQERINAQALEEHEVASVRAGHAIQRDYDLLYIFAPVDDKLITTETTKPVSNGTISRLGSLVTKRYQVLTQADLPTKVPTPGHAPQLSLVGAYLNARAVEASKKTVLGMAAEDWLGAMKQLRAEGLRECLPETQTLFVPGLDGYKNITGALPPSHLQDGALKFYETYRTRCTEYLAAHTATIAARTAFTGELGAVAMAQEQAAKNTAQAGDGFALAQSQLNKAKAAFKKAEAAKAIGTELGDCKSANLAPARKDLCEARERFEKLGPLAKKLIAQDTLDELKQALTALSDDKVPSEVELTGKYALLSLSSHLQHALAAQRNAQSLTVSALLIERQLQEGAAAAAQRQLDAELRKSDLLAQRFEALLQEAYLLEKANALLVEQGKHKHIQAPALVGARSGELRNAYRGAYRAAQAYATSFDIGRTPAAAAQARLAAMPHREALDRSVAALAAWNSLLITPLENLSAYHASGIKPEQVAELLQAVGTLAIAYRVR